MRDEPYIAEAAALIGDPARANMLSALMDGRAATAAELAGVAGVAPSTASAHLGRLVAGGLLALERQGRHRYYRLAGPQVAHALEALSVLAETAAPRKRRPGPRDAAMRRLRSCYDHMAGETAVALAEAWTRNGLLIETPDGFDPTAAGRAELLGLGLDLDALTRRRRAFAPRCLDWSERRAHLGGALGAAVLERFLALGWVVRPKAGRTLEMTAAGRHDLAARYGLAPSA